MHVIDGKRDGGGDGGLCVLEAEVANRWGVKSPLLFVTIDCVPGCQQCPPACRSKGLWELCVSLHASARQEPERLLIPLHESVCVCDGEGTKEEASP